MACGSFALSIRLVDTARAVAGFATGTTPSLTPLLGSDAPTMSGTTAALTGGLVW